MSTFYPYQSPKDVTSGGSTKTVDIGSGGLDLLESQDAVAVLAYGIGGGSAPTHIRGVSDTNLNSKFNNISATRWVSSFAEITVAGGARNIRTLKSVPGGETIRLIGEFRDNVKVHTNPIILSNNVVNDWETRTVTLLGGDSASDVEAVIVFNYRNSNNRQWAVRRLGDSMATHAGGTDGGSQIWISAVDGDGKYETYTYAKASPLTYYTEYFEMGYIKKGTYHAVQSPEDANWASTSSVWVNKDMSSDVPFSARTLFGMWRNVTTRNAKLRAIGDTIATCQVPPNCDTVDACRVTEGARLINYSLGNTDCNFFIHGWDDDDSVKVRLMGGTLSLKGGKMSIK